MRYLVGLVALSACGRLGFNDELVGDAATDAVPPDAPLVDAGPVANRVFVTSSQIAGNFGGQAVADLACRDRALEAGLDGSFIAFVAAPAGDPFERLAGSRGWVRIDGKPVYDTVSDLRARGAVYPISLDEQGRAVTGGVWTGSNEDGTRGSSTCLDWTTNMSGQSGQWGSSTATSWPAIRYVFQDCSVQGGFLCFEIGRVVPLPPPAKVASGRVLFVAAAMWSGGSLASADLVCATEATAAGLPGTFRALLAVTGASAADRFPNLTGPWRRADNVLLTSGTLGATPLEISANVSANATHLQASASFSRAWVGAPNLTTPGTMVSTCNDWTSSADSGLGGAIAETALTAFGHPQFGQSCGAAAYLYCAQE